MQGRSIPWGIDGSVWVLKSGIWWRGRGGLTIGIVMRGRRCLLWRFSRLESLGGRCDESIDGRQKGGPYGLMFMEFLAPLSPSPKVMT